MTINNFKMDSNGITVNINELDSSKGIYLVEKSSSGICYSKSEFQRKDNKHFLSWENILSGIVNKQYCQLYIMAGDYLSGILENLSYSQLNEIIPTSLLFPIDKFAISTAKITLNVQNNIIRIDLNYIVNDNIYAQAIEESEDYIDVIFDERYNGCKFYLARRQQLPHNEKYSIKIEVPCIKEGLHYKVRINKHNTFANYCRGGGEIWELLLQIEENRFISCKTNSKLSNTYYSENEFVQIKPFISDNVYIAFWTKLKKSAKRKINIAVWGSCYTREVFHGINYLNSDYKNWYEVVCTIFHQSIISAVSKPLNIKIEKRDSGNHYKLINMYGDSEFNKSIFNSLNICKPDYLIIDLFAEANASIYELHDGGYITDAFYLLETEEFKNLNKVKKITIQDSLRFDLFKYAVKEFRNRLLQINFPLDRIILVSSRPAMQKSINGKIANWENIEWLKMSCALWDRNDDYFLSIIPESKRIDMRDIKGISMDNSPLNMSTNHLQSQYYKEVLNRINKIVLSDLLK